VHILINVFVVLATITTVGVYFGFIYGCLANKTTVVYWNRVQIGVWVGFVTIFVALALMGICHFTGSH
jgi:hypothetical protein